METAAEKQREQETTGQSPNPLNRPVICRRGDESGQQGKIGSPSISATRATEVTGATGVTGAAVAETPNPLNRPVICKQDGKAAHDDYLARMNKMYVEEQRAKDLQQGRRMVVVAVDDISDITLDSAFDTVN
jgi:hypothetical protein